VCRSWSDGRIAAAEGLFCSVQPPGATVASAALVPFTLAFATVALVPDSNAGLVFFQYTTALILAGVGTGLIVGGNVINYINE